MLKQWLCFSTSRQIKRCWDVTSRPTSIFWSVQRRRDKSSNISRIQITPFSRPQPKRRYRTRVNNAWKIRFYVLLIRRHVLSWRWSHHLLAKAIIIWRFWDVEAKTPGGCRRVRLSHECGDAHERQLSQRRSQLWRRLGSTTAGTDNIVNHKATAKQEWTFCALFLSVLAAKISCCVQMEDSEGTVQQIGAFSEGIKNLTVSVSYVFEKI